MCQAGAKQGASALDYCANVLKAAKLKRARDPTMALIVYIWEGWIWGCGGEAQIERQQRVCEKLVGPHRVDHTTWSKVLPLFTIFWRSAIPSERKALKDLVGIAINEYNQHVIHNAKYQILGSNCSDGQQSKIEQTNNLCMSWWPDEEPPPPRDVGSHARASDKIMGEPTAGVMVMDNPGPERAGTDFAHLIGTLRAASKIIQAVAVGHVTARLVPRCSKI
jgi:hypothetical protein